MTVGLLQLIEPLCANTAGVPQAGPLPVLAAGLGPPCGSGTAGLMVEEDSQELGLCSVMSVLRRPAVESKGLLCCHGFVFYATNADAAAKAAIEGLTTSWEWRRERAEIRRSAVSDH